MAIATTGGGVINQHFGHATEFLVYEVTATAIRFLSHRKVEAYCSGGDTCGEAETALQRTVRTLEGCETVLCAKIGFEPWGMLEAAGVMPNGEHAYEPIEEALRAVYDEMRAAGKLATPAEARMTA